MNTGKTRLPAKAAALAVGALALSGLAGACSSSDGASADAIVVWDYYGSSSPVKPALDLFKQEHPDVNIDYQEYDYDTFQNKLAVAVSSGAAPDLATIDMVWTPVYAAQGVLSDISELSQGELNGAPMADQYSEGALEAMDYDGRTIVLPYDFDAYALYYRKDILEQKGLTVPTTHEELLDVVEAMSEDTDGDGKADKYAFQLRPDTFEFSQFLFQEGGALVTEDGARSAFASPEGIRALDYMGRLMDAGSVYWGPDEGDSGGLAGIADERIGIFLNGPYMMGILKDGVPEQSGKWAVADAPFSKEPGSYLGGTGLVIPTGAKNPQGGWELAQFLLQPAQQELVYTKAGAAPATLEALELPALTQADPFFDGQVPFPVFEKALESAQPFPYVAGWSDIDQAITDGVVETLVQGTPPETSLKKAAATADEALQK
ncbi:ABC transporter substrate-binding protein [Actinomyces ruminicola]|uniref:ABC-type glycerol-3-phosphate transport system, substrate-binding protein n=1 Tax=Actinomyces ruminicola TaxID=332524 RepID=A0A1G9RS33_9ACTO|nr:sugar ABC transporter substrate-binding protein [Actinomyces ruminicola]SDM25983.1 ABC-type glycerol-3-phosphate transport system, substrate-binding protein [Actinomyces ruminicola]